MIINVKQLIAELPPAEQSLVQVACFVENRDANFSGHQERLAQFAALTGDSLNLSRRETAALAKAAFLHDLGMIIVPESTLAKPERLTPAEMERVNWHPLAGAKIMSPVPSLKEVIPIILHHHERANGQGYPEKLTHDNIHVLAQVFSVLDVYDALRSPRAQRAAYSSVEALKILGEEAEWGHHDPDIVTCITHLVESGKFDDIDTCWRVCSKDW